MKSTVSEKFNLFILFLYTEEKKSKSNTDDRKKEKKKKKKNDRKKLTWIICLCPVFSIRIIIVELKRES